MRSGRQSGFTLIEILISLVVLSVGLLGLAGMQMIGMRSNSSASARSQAAAFASDIAERMRANPSADALRPAFDNLDSEDVDCGETPPLCSDYYESGAKDGVSCTPVQMATHDINVLACGYLYNGARTGGVADRLPEGRFTISCGAACAGTPPSNATYEIRVFWTELQPRGGSIERSVSMAVTP